MANERIVIIGAGFSGVALAIRLKQAGIDDFEIVEKADDVGGVWRDNVYPGAACDVESHLYSFSFERNPDWSREFAGQAEILEYLKACVSKYDLRRHVRFGTEVKRADFDDHTGLWTLETNRGPIVGRVLVAGTGGLSRPAWPNIPGIHDYRGTSFHTARWDRTASLDGKRVGLIGTGASAIQIVPEIAKRVEHLTVFQRSAPWVLPKADGPISERRRALYRRFPVLGWLERARIYWTNELRVIAMARKPGLMKKGEQYALGYMKSQIRDPELRRKLTPHYSLGCKRILLSNDYYPALARENVDVVTEGIDRIEAEGVRTRDGARHSFDALIYATGFHAGDGGAPFPTRGSGGVDLDDAWAEGAFAYKGLTVPGFPNLFIMTGPNTGLSHSSIILMIESSASYVVDAVRTMRRRRLDQVDVRPEACAAFNQEIQRRLENTIWSSGCQSYYQAPNGKNVAIWPSFTFEYWGRTRAFDLDSYRVVERSQTRRAVRRVQSTRASRVSRSMSAAST